MKKHWIVDAHCDSIGDYCSGKRDLKTDTDSGHWDLNKAKRGGIGLQFMAAYIESEYKPHLATWRGLQLLDSGHHFIEENKDTVFLVKNRSDIDKLGNQSLGIILSVEGGEILGESLFMLDIIYRLGVRSLGLTWNERNAIGDGVGETSSKSGLSDFGKKVIARMNLMGMLIDVSHLNEPGFWDVLKISDKPIVASHSCAKALCSHPRNLSDDQLRALADNKGVVGINFCPDFLNSNVQASIDDVAKHICHIVEVAGVDTIGFGSDFDGIPSTPKGLENAEMFTQLLDKLRDYGFNQTEISKICHGNFLRVLSNVLE
ncbi:MAG: peptidase [Gracilibacter sp. BRH_c7a]|nr:MAG: peptidase [Gracilibacter sp. BRH_c7a]